MKTANSKSVMMMKAVLCATVALTAMALATSSPTKSGISQTKVMVGAIRWDAWFGAPPGIGGIVGRTVTTDLSPQHYHYRLPFFAKEHEYDPTTNSTVTIQGNTAEVMSAEIKYATDFGIDFWAFCAYPLGCQDYNTPMSECPKIQCCAANYQLSYALNLYLGSEQRDQVKFSLILQSSNWYPGISHGGNETVEQEADRYVEYFKMPNHHSCCGGRPIVYLFGGVGADAAAALAVLQSKTKAALGVEPYVITMSGSWDQAKAKGYDAITRYLVQSNPTNAAGVPFEKGIVQPEVAMWQQTKEQQGKLMPSISPGWDPSPREYIDLPWGDQGHTACVIKLGHPCYIQDPTMAQLTSHTAEAIKFVLDNPTVTEPNAVLIGAWNENDEGHWIIPSLYNGTQKLEAVQKGIQQAHAEFYGTK